MFKWDVDVNAEEFDAVSCRVEYGENHFEMRYWPRKDPRGYDGIAEAHVSGYVIPLYRFEHFLTTEVLMREMTTWYEHRAFDIMSLLKG